LLGSVWLWLTWRAGRVHLVTTRSADTPIVRGHVPLLALDLWEHAYSLDYHNQKLAYADAFLTKLVNWDFAESQLRKLVEVTKSALNLVTAGIEAGPPLRTLIRTAKLQVWPRCTAASSGCPPQASALTDGLHERGGP
jgi:hypothetical protein